MDELKPCPYSRPQISSAVNRMTQAAIKQDPSYLWPIDYYVALWALKYIDRPAQENKPLTLEELRQMDGRRVWTQFRGLGMYGLVAYHSDPDGDDGDDVYITNNLGGRSTYEEILSQGGAVYARKPEGSESHGTSD